MGIEGLFVAVQPYKSLLAALILVPNTPGL